MNRRMFLGRFLGGVGVAALGAGTAKALVASPDLGQEAIRDAVVPVNKRLNQIPHVAEEWWKKPVEWLGDPLNHNRPLSEWLHFQPSSNGTIMQGFFPPHTDAEFADAFEFYMGLQWPEVTMQKRMHDGRPSLTINMVKGILDRAIIVSRERGEDTQLLERDWREIIVNVYRRNRDAQIHYNALQSARAEMMMAQRGYFDPLRYTRNGVDDNT